MASDSSVPLSGFRAGADLSTKQYYIMKAEGTTADQMTVCSGTGDLVECVLYDKPDTQGDPADFRALQAGTVVKVKVGSAGLTAGQVGTDANGLAVIKVANNDIVFGSVDTTYASGDIAEVLCQGRSYLGA